MFAPLTDIPVTSDGKDILLMGLYIDTVDAHRCHESYAGKDSYFLPACVLVEGTTVAAKIVNVIDGTPETFAKVLVDEIRSYLKTKKEKRYIKKGKLADEDECTLLRIQKLVTYICIDTEKYNIKNSNIGNKCNFVVSITRYGDMIRFVTESEEMTPRLDVNIPIHSQIFRLAVVQFFWGRFPFPADKKTLYK
eukprot:GHVR01075620.1.p1 GENE.GHVR01075620.1~~GHVR01075620.1.p1  ORF type:complete len:193 (+),score=42.83 GHVR01075620.1:654-1232(+)